MRQGHETGVQIIPCLIFEMITFYKEIGIFYPPSLFFCTPHTKILCFFGRIEGDKFPNKPYSEERKGEVDESIGSTRFI